MSISIWRYSHLILAISSSLFLVIASVTGVVLALEPISDAIQPYEVHELEEVSLSQAIVALQKEYDEVISLEVDANDFVLASVITKEGKSETIYVNPVTAEKLGVPRDKEAVFEFARNLHRSLFLKSIGRFFVGLISFLLCLISVTGVFLIAKRQGGIKRIFSKVRKEYFEQRYHVIFGRWFLLPILLIAATGVYLSVERFSLLPSTSIDHDLAIENSKELTSLVNEFSIFKTTHLNDVRKVSFPFSGDEEDYFQIELNDKELLIHQYTGTVISEVNYPFVVLATRLSFALHTGQGSVLWSVVLLLASCSILFFMYSGFVMTYKRRKKVKISSDIKNKDECEYIILVGSETGSTFDFARILYNALIEANQSVFMTELNAYSDYKNAKHIIVLTATYGEGEATTNARKFEQLFGEIKPKRALQFSVVGFGSKQYPDYCYFAIKVDTLLRSSSVFKSVLPLFKINNQSFDAFQDWAEEWSKQVGLSLVLKRSVEKMKSFKVRERSETNVDDTFLIQLRLKRNIKFESGDLLSIEPGKGEAERLYSIARIGNDVLLSIKKHEFGVCSSFLSELDVKNTIKARIKANPNFHFPTNTLTSLCHPEKSVILIANGTGIAPFLGMLDQNKVGVTTHLFWGGRTEASLEIYRKNIEDVLSRKQLSSFAVAYSQEDKKEYVQDIIFKESDLISKGLDSGSTIMICGSLAMQQDVWCVLDQISKNKLNKPLLDYEEQIKIDCY